MIFDVIQIISVSLNGSILTKLYEKGIIPKFATILHDDLTDAIFAAQTGLFLITIIFIVISKYNKKLYDVRGKTTNYLPLIAICNNFILLRPIYLIIKLLTNIQ